MRYEEVEEREGGTITYGKKTSIRTTSARVVSSDHVTHERLTALNPGKRRTAEAVSNGNGRNCFMPSEVWTAGMAGRTRAGMRPF